MKLHAYINDARRRDLEKLTPAMWQMLFDVRDHDDTGYSLRGRSEHGGAQWTHRALIKRGLLKGDKLTPSGLKACSVEWRDMSEANAEASDRP